MHKTTLQMSHPYGETPSNIFSDLDWVRKNEKALLEKYGECSIIVYQQTVIGVGDTYEKALANAEQHSTSYDQDKITPVHERLRHRNPFWRVKPMQHEKRAQN